MYHLLKEEMKKYQMKFSGKKYYDGLVFHRVIDDFMIQEEILQELAQVAQVINLLMSLLIFHIVALEYFQWQMLDLVLMVVSFS